MGLAVFFQIYLLIIVDNVSCIAQQCEEFQWVASTRIHKQFMDREYQYSV